MYKVIGLLLLIFCGKAVFAQTDFTIFEVRRQLAMSNTEKTFKDFYIHGGSESGLQAGQVYDVVRKVPLYDAFKNRSAGELDIKVAKVQVIYVDKSISVARYHQDFSREMLPVLDDNFILIGDRLDPATAAKSAQESSPASPQQPQPPQQKEANQNEPVKVVINSVDVSAEVFGSTPNSDFRN